MRWEKWAHSEGGRLKWWGPVGGLRRGRESLGAAWAPWRAGGVTTDKFTGVGVGEAVY